MKQIKIKESDFDFKKFVKAIILYLKENTGFDDVYEAIDKLDDQGCYDGDFKGKKFNDMLSYIKEGGSMFLRFTDAYNEEDVLCADGNEIEISEKYAYGDTESFGYIVSFKKDSFIIDSGRIGPNVMCQLPPIIEEENWKPFDKNMEKFIEKFKN